ncbi:MAG TPA: GNAT family N-acetyltransferase [Stellaceae bacterium]|jgi:GNAT superfamily N-acetyltransferase|nr:GNAT family N-acetyltransferase [Stellaceae bacterium]
MTARSLSWRVEETCFNAFPALKQVLLGDWLMRFSNGVSRRANSVNPLRADCRAVADAIGAAERLYAAQGQPTIFRVPTIADASLDRELADRGYASEGETCVIYGRIDAVPAASDPAVQLMPAPDAVWLSAMAALQGYDEAQAATYRRIVDAIAAEARFALLTIDFAPAALAYGVLHDGLLCYESVITDGARRRQGLGRRLIASLAAWAHDSGAIGACLQVQADNTPARALYGGFGLTTELHRYHYRRAPVVVAG